MRAMVKWRDTRRHSQLAQVNYGNHQIDGGGGAGGDVGASHSNVTHHSDKTQLIFCSMLFLSLSSKSQLTEKFREKVFRASISCCRRYLNFS